MGLMLEVACMATATCRQMLSLWPITRILLGFVTDHFFIAYIIKLYRKWHIPTGYFLSLLIIKAVSCAFMHCKFHTLFARSFSHRGMFLGVYAGLGFSQALFVLLAAFALAVGGIFASRKLHDSMMNSIMRSPMSFFDTTPLGRILNRFSKDIYTIDETIPRSLRGFIMTAFAVISTLIVILIATPIFVVVIFPLAFLYAFIQVCIYTYMDIHVIIQVSCTLE